MYTYYIYNIYTYIFIFIYIYISSFQEYQQIYLLQQHIFCFSIEQLTPLFCSSYYSFCLNDIAKPVSVSCICDQCNSCKMSGFKICLK